ncbi:hypothetical protein SPRG_18389 [Saprolegnia parasitica CBS 223.65]|uniref:Uncharacterized protein n=1 Tax=Saprolegnia parasitica (strain CBS 223.65) TaxID=695850 RepID=A0A067BCJ3_SAPPC|nr:hypothetical protein SPRG_18389 [Saprolegnia parasitica CBS 223.65]KDO16079.1 hypothetical protein SPRG_18389 [Saprolegnia parasitica CBS 223.65]|eukprot:XP_012213214.1 hypothetical protein SPRG_18389 [Saprolegnia parasitica CBS 223.65]
MRLWALLICVVSLAEARPNLRLNHASPFYERVTAMLSALYDVSTIGEATHDDAFGY